MAPAEIKGLRSALGLTQGELAPVVNAHGVTVSRWESGILRPSAFQAGLLTVLRQALPEIIARRLEVRELVVSEGVLGVLRLAFSLSQRQAACAECGGPTVASTRQGLDLCGPHLVAIVENPAWRAAHLRSGR